MQAAVQVPLAHSNLQLATAEVVGLEVRGGVRHDLDWERRGSITGNITGDICICKHIAHTIT